MKAVIPAAGEGKRFNKDSTYMHKCLVPINGKALLLYTLENLTNIKEITECIVIIGENHEKIIDLLDRFVYISDKLKIKYLQYEELLDLVSNIDSLKDSLVIAEEGLGLLNNENILKLACK